MVDRSAGFWIRAACLLVFNKVFDTFRARPRAGKLGLACFRPPGIRWPTRSASAPIPDSTDDKNYSHKPAISILLPGYGCRRAIGY